MRRKTGRDAFCFITHFVNDFVIEQIDKVVRELSSEKMQIWIFYNLKDDKSNDFDFKEKWPGVSVFKYDEKTLEAEHFEKPGFDMHNRWLNAEIPMLTWAKTYRSLYDFVWFMEYDVLFNGDWNDVIGLYEDNDADLISSHIGKHDPYWYWKDAWNFRADFLERHPLKKDDFFNSFNPLMRLSRSLLGWMYRLYKNGSYGYSELVIPTFLNWWNVWTEDESERMRYENLKFVSNQGDLDKSSMRFKPEWNVSEIVDHLIYHPVKNTKKQ